MSCAGGTQRREPHLPQTALRHNGEHRTDTSNQLWQTDLFTFVLKRENRRVHLVGYLDDHSRMVVGYGLHATASGVLVRETLLAAIANFGAPQEVDNSSWWDPDPGRVHVEAPVDATVTAARSSRGGHAVEYA